LDLKKPVRDPARVFVMNKKETTILIFALGAGALLFIMAKKSYYTILNWFLPEWETFSPVVYWDVSRYSWGYGTEAPYTDPSMSLAEARAAAGIIDEPRARAEMLSHIDNNYAYLQTLISRTLTPSQWAALLSFSYNLGPGNADNLISNINSGNDSALEEQWKQYINAGGKPRSDLIARRNAEWAFWIA
jgi:GH24 family phage-related lysozyme (muramidase)